MAYRRYHHAAKATPRDMTVRFAGKCACCGAEIKAGEWATYYPAGTAGDKACIAHCGGLDGTSQRCTVELRKQFAERAVNDYAGNGVDSRYEDDCAEICGR